MKEGGTLNRLPSSEKKNESFATITIRGSLGNLRNGTRLQMEKVTVPVKVGELLENLSRLHGLELRRDSTLVMVNGVEANALQDLDTVIVEGDEISLVPMFHGGSQFN